MLKILTLVGLLALFNASAMAYTPEEVMAFSTFKSYIYTAYARALVYLPDKVSTGLQKKLAIWAYDPSGRSIYGTINITVTANNTIIGTANTWYNSPYVTGAAQSGPTNFGGIVNYHGTDGFYRYYNYSTTTRGTSGIQGGTSCGSSYYGTLSAYVNVWGSTTTSTCGALSASCIIGESGVVFGDEDWWSQSYQISQGYWGVPNYGSGYLKSFNYISGCSPSVSTDEFSLWRSLPLPDEYLRDTADIIRVLSSVANNADAFPADRSQASTAINMLHSGVAVPDGIIAPGEVASVPDTVWDLAVGDVIGGGAGGAAVIVATSIVNVSVNVSTQEIVDQLDEANNFWTRGTVPEVDSFDYDTYVAPMISKSTGILSSFLINITSAPFFTLLDKFSVEESSAPLFGCKAFDVPSFNLHEQICFEDIPGFNLFLNICYAMVQISAFWFASQVLYKGSL